MVSEVKAFQTAGGKLCKTIEEAENEELQEMEEGFIEGAAKILFPHRAILSIDERTTLLYIFRKQEEFKILLEEYNIYE